MHKYGQSKRTTLIEASLNVLTGMFVAFAISQLAAHYEPEIQLYIYSGFHWNISVASNLIMTGILTFCSVARGYIWRRIFNRLHLKQLTKLLENEA